MVLTLAPGGAPPEIKREVSSVKTEEADCTSTTQGDEQLEMESDDVSFSKVLIFETVVVVDVCIK